MSIYAQAVQSGVTSLELLATGSSAATQQAYNQAYSEATQRANVLAVRQTLQKNIAAVQQDKVTSNTAIQMKQDQAEAWAKVSAATAGVEGGSVDDAIYDTKKNESFALQASQREADQKIAGLATQVGNQTSSYAGISNTELSMTGDLLQAFSSFELSDLDIAEAFSGGSKSNGSTDS